MSGPQSRYYYGVVIPFLLQWLNIKEEYYEIAADKIHDAIKKCFNIVSFSDLSVAEFEKVMSTLRMLGARQWAICIPEPDEIGMDVLNMSMRDFLIHKKLI